MSDRRVNGLVVKECDRCSFAQVEEWLSGAELVRTDEQAHWMAQIYRDSRLGSSNQTRNARVSGLTSSSCLMIARTRLKLMLLCAAARR
jgi:hypothetical protein